MGLMAWGPEATSVFLRWRVETVPATLEGRLSTSKPAGVRASPLYRRAARSRSAEVVEDGVLSTGGVETLAGWLPPEEGAAPAPPPPPPQAVTSIAMAARMKMFRRFTRFPCRITSPRAFIVSIVTRSYFVLGPAAAHEHLRERSTVGRLHEPACCCQRFDERFTAVRRTN